MAGPIDSLAPRDFLGTGWYVSGTWIVTGENKSDEIEPDKPLFRGGIGAIEIGARYDELGFGSVTEWRRWKQQWSESSPANVGPGGKRVSR